jgi:hypothetical protein
VEWLFFLKVWYMTVTPPEGDISVCTLGVAASEVLAVGQILLNPSVSGLVDGGHKIVTKIVRQVDWVFVEYGIDITPLLEERRRLHHLQGKLVAHKSSLNRPKRHRRGEASPVRQKKRRLQDNDYLVLFGGDVAGDYNQSNFSAFGDHNFYWLEDASGNLDAIYGFDNGSGVKEIPVMYFPSSNPITPEGVPFGISEEDAVADLGGEFGFLSFSKESAQDGNTYSKIPRSAGGQIVPVIYVEGFIGDTFLDVLVGDGARLIP